MKEYFRDAANTFKYLILFLIGTLAAVIVIFLCSQCDIIWQYSFFFKNFHIIKFFLLKIKTIVFFLIPLAVFLTAIFTFVRVTRKEFRMVPATLALVVFLLILCTLIYGIFLSDPYRLRAIERAYQPQYKDSIPFIFTGKIQRWGDAELFFTKNQAWFYRDGYVGKAYKLDMQKNRIIVASFDNGIDAYFPYITKKAPLDFFVRFENGIPRLADYKAEVMTYLDRNAFPFYLIYLFCFAMVSAFFPVILHNRRWSFNDLFLSFTTLFAALIAFLALFHFSSTILSDLKIPKAYIYYFPAIVFFIIYCFEILLVYIRVSQAKFRDRIRETAKSRTGKR